MSKREKNNVHIWLPGAGEFRGGIQVYGAWLIRAFRKALGDQAVTIFLKNNKKSPDSSIVRNSKTLVFGNRTGLLRTCKFALRVVIEYLKEHPKFVLVGHIRFLPLAILLKKLFGIPIWLVVYGVEAWDLTLKQKRQLARLDKIISISTYTRAKLIEQISPIEKLIEVLPCVVALEDYRPSPRSLTFFDKHSIPQGAKVLLTVARLEGAQRRKGHRMVFKALTELKTEIPDIHYIVVGDGVDREDLEREAHALNLPVTFTGFVSDQELIEVYACCDVFVMPSDKEGFGIVFIEALACGKPVIAARNSGARDIVTDNKLGSLIDVDNLVQLKAAISNNLALREEDLADYRRNSVAERYSVQGFFDQVQSLLSQ